jgi:hypothetical protein
VGVGTHRSISLARTLTTTFPNSFAAALSGDFTTGLIDFTTKCTDVSSQYLGGTIAATCVTTNDGYASGS